MIPCFNVRGCMETTAGVDAHELQQRQRRGQKQHFNGFTHSYYVETKARMKAGGRQTIPFHCITSTQKQKFNIECKHQR